MNPEISIIVPVHNVEKYLNVCIESILAQTYSNFEVILVNDGSTDQCRQICDSYAQIDNRVKVIHQEYKGVSSARNAGIRAVTGEFIGFVDGDDRIDKDMYRNLLNLCNNHSSEISVCKLGREIDGKLINEVGHEFLKVFDNVEGMRELFKGILYRFSLCNKLFKKNCFEGIEFPEGRIHEDLSTTYKLFAKANRVVYTNYIGYIYVKRSNSILTSKFNEKRLEAFIGWDEILQFMNEKYPELNSVYSACYIYGCVDNIYYILNQVKSKESKEKYLRNIQFHVNKHPKNILICKEFSLKYKYLILLIKYNVGLLLLLDRIKKLINS